MKAITKSFPFWLGIITGIVLSLVISIVDHEMKFDALCMDCDNDFGFPLKIYQSGTYIQPTKILWTGLLGNIIIYGLLSFCLGLVFHSRWNSKILK